MTVIFMHFEIENEELLLQDPPLPQVSFWDSPVTKRRPLRASKAIGLHTTLQRQHSTPLQSWGGYF